MYSSGWLSCSWRMLHVSPPALAATCVHTCTCTVLTCTLYIEHVHVFSLSAFELCLTFFTLLTFPCAYTCTRLIMCVFVGCCLPTKVLKALIHEATLLQKTVASSNCSLNVSNSCQQYATTQHCIIHAATLLQATIAGNKVAACMRGLKGPYLKAEAVEEISWGG